MALTSSTPLTVPELCPRRLKVADGTLEALKWVALLIMTLDHINKYFFAEKLPGIFALGRIVMPIFGFVLAYNAARPVDQVRRVRVRMIRRLLVFGALATPAVLLLNRTVMVHHPWWPLNILLTLLIALVVIELYERGGWWRLLIGGVLFLIGGAFVEYLWFGLLTVLSAYAFCKCPRLPRLGLFTLATLSLSLLNQNAYAVLAIPVLLLATRISLTLSRTKWFFYAYYPAHLSVLFLLKGTAV